MVKNLLANAGDAADLGSIPGLGNDYPLQCICLENSMDRGVHGVAKGWTQLSDYHFHFQALE